MASFPSEKNALPIPPPKKSISRCSCISSFAFQNLLLKEKLHCNASVSPRKVSPRKVSQDAVALQTLELIASPPSVSPTTASITLSLACYVKVIGHARLMHCTIAQLHIYDVFPFASLTINCLPPSIVTFPKYAWICQYYLKTIRLTVKQ